MSVVHRALSVLTCGHPDRPFVALGMCKPCYRKHYSQRVSVTRDKKVIVVSTAKRDPSRNPCCGSRFDKQTIICCLVDPREILVDGRPKRATGDWCLWCGDPVVDGQSFCMRACGISYTADVGLHDLTPDAPSEASNVPTL